MKKLNKLGAKRLMNVAKIAEKFKDNESDVISGAELYYIISQAYMEGYRSGYTHADAPFIPTARWIKSQAKIKADIIYKGE